MNSRHLPFLVLGLLAATPAHAVETYSGLELAKGKLPLAKLFAQDCALDLTKAIPTVELHLGSRKDPCKPEYDAASKLLGLEGCNLVRDQRDLDALTVKATSGATTCAGEFKPPAAATRRLADAIREEARLIVPLPDSEVALWVPGQPTGKRWVAVPVRDGRVNVAAMNVPYAAVAYFVDQAGQTIRGEFHAYVRLAYSPLDLAEPTTLELPKAAVTLSGTVPDAATMRLSLREGATMKLSESHACRVPVTGTETLKLRLDKLQEEGCEWFFETPVLTEPVVLLDVEGAGANPTTIGVRLAAPIAPVRRVPAIISRSGLQMGSAVPSGELALYGYCASSPKGWCARPVSGSSVPLEGPADPGRWPDGLKAFGANPPRFYDLTVNANPDEPDPDYNVDEDCRKLAARDYKGFQLICINALQPAAPQVAQLLSGKPILRPHDGTVVVVAAPRDEKFKVTLGGSLGLDPGRIMNQVYAAPGPGPKANESSSAGKTVRAYPFGPRLPGAAILSMQRDGSSDKQEVELVVEQFYNGAFRLGTSFIFLDAVDRTYGAFKAPGSAQYQVHGDAAAVADAEVVATFSAFPWENGGHGRSYLNHQWLSLAPFLGLGLTSEIKNPLQVVRSIYFGVDWELGSNFSLGLGGVFRRVNRLPAGMHIGSPLADGNAPTVTTGGGWGVALLVNVTPDFFKLAAAPVTGNGSGNPSGNR